MKISTCPPAFICPPQDSRVTNVKLIYSSISKATKDGAFPELLKTIQSIGTVMKGNYTVRMMFNNL